MNLPERYQRSSLRQRPDNTLVQYRSAERPGSIELLGIMAIFKRRILLISSIVAICALLALLLTLAMPRQYMSHVDLAIEADAPAELPGVGDDKTPVQTEQLAERIESELQVLHSRHLAERLLTDLNLPQDPVFRSAVLHPQGLISNLRRLVGLRPNEEDIPAGVEETNSFRQAAADFIMSGMDAVALGKSSAVRLTFTATDPELAQKIADGFAQSYQRDRIASKVAQNLSAIATLQGRMEELRMQAQNDFGAVQRYRIQNNLLSSAATALTENEISTYNQQVAAARADASQDQAQLRAARTQLQANPNQASVSSSVVASLRAQRASLSANVADMAQRYRPDHPDLVTARRQLSDIDQQISQEVGRSVRELEARASASSSRLHSLTQSQSATRVTLAQNNNSLIQLDGLQRRAEASQALYEGYLNRYKETVARSGAETSGVQILSPARLARGPISPNPPLNLAFGLMMGGLLGGLAAVAAEMNFPGLTTPDDVERKLGLNYVGSLPLLKAVGSPAKTCAEAVRIHPGGIMAESLRSISTRLSYLVPRFKVLAVTSSVAGEGKTTLSTSLARVLGRAGIRVVLIDCDVARPQLSRQAGADPGAPGLFDVVHGHATLDQAMIADEVANVSILPITRDFPKGDQLTEGTGLHRTIIECRDRFDIVILDCSPILAISESREIVAFADVTLFSVLWRKTSDSTVTAALRLIPDAALSRIGVVLNKVDIRKRRRFGGSDATFFYRQHRHYYSDGVE